MDENLSLIKIYSFKDILSRAVDHDEDNIPETDPNFKIVFENF